MITATWRGRFAVASALNCEVAVMNVREAYAALALAIWSGVMCK
jgi:hypothetical protein